MRLKQLQQRHRNVKFWPFWDLVNLAKVDYGKKIYHSVNCFHKGVKYIINLNWSTLNFYEEKWAFLEVRNMIYHLVDKQCDDLQVCENIICKYKINKGNQMEIKFQYNMNSWIHLLET